MNLNEDIEQLFCEIVKNFNLGKVDYMEAIRKIKKLQLQNVIGRPRKINVEKVHDLKGEGFNNAEIAVKLKISVSSVGRALQKNVENDVDIALPPVKIDE